MAHHTTAAEAARQLIASRPTSSAPVENGKNPGSSRERLSASQAESLWLRLTAIYGHRFTSAYGDDPKGVAGDTWARALADLTQTQLTAGLHACALSSDGWPPTLPMFRSLCLGVPTLAEVRIELRAGHPNPSAFARLCWHFLDSYAYQRADSDKSDRMLRDAYDLAREHVMNGGDLPAPAVAEIAREAVHVKPASPEVAEAALREIQSHLYQRDTVE